MFLALHLECPRKGNIFGVWLTRTLYLFDEDKYSLRTKKYSESHALKLGVVQLLASHRVKITNTKLKLEIL